MTANYFASPNASPERSSSRRYHFVLVVSAIILGVIALSAPVTQDAISRAPGKGVHSPAWLFGQTVLADARDFGPWHAEGSRIVTANGQTVRISGVNWSGFETTNMAPGGLKVQDYRSILRSVRAAGYNTVRIPFSSQMVESPIVPSDIRFESAAGKRINEDLANLDAMQILDRIIDAAGQAGLKVILDNHRSEAGSSAQPSGLWYTAQYPESSWIADWTSLASRYQDNATVIGFDLRNEPHNAKQGGSCWSCGGVTDWHLAAQRAGNAILHVNSKLLIFVEGTDTVDDETDFWGGNLAGVRTAPVRLSIPGRLVYSVHVYGPTEYQQGWFNATTTPATLAALYQRHWGFISESGIAPVWIGEFGTPNNDVDIASTEPGSEGQWFQSLVAYLASHPKIGWSYWGINGEDRYGLLDAAYDATPVNTRKAEALASICLPSRFSSPATAALEVPLTAADASAIRSSVPLVTYAVPHVSSPQRPNHVASAARALPAAGGAIESSVAEQVRLATTRALRSTSVQAE